jgi:2-C-methyl-D-erythritol 2,4-cyclodiphosphate synthase
MAPHLPAKRERLASLLALGVDRVNLKAKTQEGLDAIGRGEAIGALVVALVEPAA